MEGRKETWVGANSVQRRRKIRGQLPKRIQTRQRPYHLPNSQPVRGNVGAGQKVRLGTHDLAK